MYDNIGGKIKCLAKALFIVSAIVEVIIGIALMATDENLIVYGMFVMVVGPLVAWISSWLLYGFGHLIENSDNIKNCQHIISKNIYIVAENSNDILESITTDE